MLWWLLGIGGLYGTYRFILFRQKLLAVTISELISKIVHHRELAKKGDQNSLKYLKSLDPLVYRLEKDTGSSSAQTIVAALQLKGLYPPSAI